MHDTTHARGAFARSLPIVEQAAHFDAPVARERQPELAGAWRALARFTGRVLTIGGLVAAGAVLLLVAASTVPALLGDHTFVIDGESMGPSLSLGSVAVTAPTSPAELKTGDVIAYRSSAQSAPVLHRIVSITESGSQRLFTTQGDRNETPDPTPVALNGQGDKVIYDVPLAGYILNFAKSGLGRGLLMALPLVLLAALFVAQIRRLSGMRQPQTQQSLPETTLLSPPQVMAERVEPAPVVRAPAPRPPRLTLVVPGGHASNAEDIPAFLTRQLQRNAATRGVTPIPLRLRTGTPGRRVAA